MYAGDERDDQEQIAEYVLEDIAPIVVGEDPFAVELLWERLRTRSSDVSDRELYMHALGAVDSAIWDTIGRILDVPLYELWGGYRKTLPMVAIGGYYEDGKGLDELIEEAVEYVNSDSTGSSSRSAASRWTKTSNVSPPSETNLDLTSALLATRIRRGNSIVH